MTLRPLTLIGIIISIVTGTSLGVLLHIHTGHKSPSDPALTLTEALRHVNENYVEEVNQTELLDNAIEGMMRGLDDHSGYLNPSAYSSLEANTRGEFGGIGIELGLVDGYFTIISPMDDTPADEAGVEPGDRITALNGESVKGKKLADIVETLRGKPGTVVDVRVRREDNPDPIDFALQRAVIQLQSVRSRMLEPGYGYIRISQFQSNTASDVTTALQALERDADGQLHGLVVDLRNNPGGTLQSSVQVADHFLERGLIVYTEGRLKSSHAKYRATRGDLLDGAPIVVLINKGSASASEIVAGALQDHGRAQLVGSKSYGKGSVQAVVPLAENQALKITTAHYYTPNGRSIHKQGIEPDIPLQGEEEDLLDKAVALLKLAPNQGLQARAD
ncbi:MAG: S41 family peptidase [Pseudomonadota bacterium]